MEPVTLAAVAAVGAALRLWAWQRVARRRAREAARGEHLRHLPPGSRIVDLGEHGVVIDVGGRQDHADTHR